MAIKRPKLKFKKGNTYVIDQSDASNANHPLRFTADSGATEYTHGVTITGTPGQAGATVTFNVPDSAPENIMYYCSTHGLGMGNHLKTFAGPGPFEWGGDRAITMGGYYTNAAGTGGSPGGNNGETYITYYSISTAGTANDFGDMTTFGSTGSAEFAAASNGTRVVTVAGRRMGSSNAGTDDINYYTTAVPSDTTFFGNLIVPSAGYMANGPFAACDGTKAIMGGGWAYTTSVQYGSNQGLQQITVDTTGNATYQAPMGQQLYSAGAWNNNTRALIYGANDTQAQNIDKAQIFYYTFDTSADCVSFGNINTTNANGDTVHHNTQSGISGDSTYMLICGGRHYYYPTTSSSDLARNESNEIDYVAMATTGNASAFGSLIGERRGHATASDGTYTTLSGGTTNNSNSNQASWGSSTNYIERIVVQTPGNAVDFGDLIYYHRNGTASSGAAA